MGSFNRIILMGHLGQTPEVRDAGGHRMAGFSLATSTSWSKDGAKQERTTWHRVVVWGKLAELAASKLTKGSPVLIEGAYEGREYVDKEGNKQRLLEVRASNLQLIEKRADAEARRGGKATSFPGHEQGSVDYDSEVPF